MSEAVYNKQFFEQLNSTSSADVIVPLVIDLVRARSVVDLGCGAGDFLAAFERCGVIDLIGVDGEYAPRDVLKFPASQFRAHDLAQPLEMPRTFELAVSLEVAEHLPPSAGEAFVGTLVRLAPVVLFSAAIPMQDGTGHVNERWPDYWAGLFARYGYDVIDCLRPRIWNDDRVLWWYRQNVLIFASEAAISSNPRLLQARKQSEGRPLALVHPDAYLAATLPKPTNCRHSVVAAFRATGNMLRRRFRLAVPLDTAIQRAHEQFRFPVRQERANP